MDMTIYTSGSVEFLEIMLNSTAMITGSGTTEDLAKIGALIGLLIIAFQAIFSNQPIGFQKPLLLVVLYALFYGPTTTVIIEDTVSNQARVVDNIPLGPAAIGSIISTISHGIAKTSEQAHSLPGMTEHGLFNSLYTLTTVRAVLNNPTSLDSYNNFRSGAGVSLPKTFREHMIYCVGNPTSLDESGINERKRASNASTGSYLGAIETTRHAQHTRVFNGVNGSDPEILTCAQSYQFLVSSFRDALPDMMDEVLVRGFNTELKQNRIMSGTQLRVSLDDAIQSLALTNKSAQEYAITSVVISEFEKGRADAIEHWHGARASVALRDALNQQELQWAGKGDVFKHYMRPMISFFEGLLYGITPFMAFALLLGGTGISILGKYLMLPLTVGMWMPLLSIVNAFTLWYAGAQIEPILDAYDPTSTGFAIQQMADLDQAISKALGVGGLLASSVPALALFIVSGSAYVANSVMSNITSGEKFRSEDITPRVQESAPSLSNVSMFTGSQTTSGAGLTGARERAVSFSGQDAAESSIRSAENFQKESMSSLQESMDTTTAMAMNTTEGRQLVSSLGNQLSSSLDLSSSSAFNEANSTLRQAGYSEDQVAAGVFEAGVSGGKFFTRGGWKDTEQYREMSSEQQSEVDQAMATIGSTVQARTTDGTTLQLGEQLASGTTASMGITNTEKLSETLTAAQKSTEVYERAQANRSSLAQSQSIDLAQVAANAIKHGGTALGVSGADATRLAEERFFTEPEDRARLAHHLGMVNMSGITLDDNEARMAAMALTLQESGRFGEMVNSEYNPFMLSPSTGDAGRNSSLATLGADLSARTGPIEGRLNEQYGQNAEAISGAGIGSGHEDIATRGREQIQGEDSSNKGLVTGHNANSTAYISDQYQSKETELTQLSSVSPNADWVQNGANSTAASITVAKNDLGHLRDKVASFVGLGSEEGSGLSPHTYTNPETGEHWTAPEHMQNSDVPYFTPWEVAKHEEAAMQATALENARPKAPKLPTAPSLDQAEATGQSAPPRRPSLSTDQ